MLLEKISNAVVEGDDEVVCELVEKALAEGTGPLEILEQGNCSKKEKCSFLKSSCQLQPCRPETTF